MLRLRQLFYYFPVTSLNALRSLLCVVNSSGCLETVSRNHIHAQGPDLQMKELVTAARVQGGQNIWTQWNCVDRRCHSQPPEQNVCVCVLVMGLTAVSNGSCLTGPWEMESKRSIRYNVNNDPSSHCAARDKSIKDPSPCRRHHPLPTAYRKKRGRESERERRSERDQEWMPKYKDVFRAAHEEEDWFTHQNCLLTLQQQPVMEEGLNCEVFAGTVHWQLWNHTLIVHFVLEPRSFDVKMTWSEQVFLCSESPWCPDVCGFYKYECGMLLQCKYVQVENSYSSGAPPTFHRRIKVQDQTIEPVIVYSLRKAKAETCAARDEQRAGRTANVSPCLMCHNWKFHYRGKSHTHARNVIHMTRMNGGRYGQLRLRWVSIGPKPVLGQ